MIECSEKRGRFVSRERSRSGDMFPRHEVRMT
jgi:hypothetical protein